MVRSFRALFPLLCCTFLAASLAMLVHSLPENRQIDAQLFTFALEFLRSLHEGSLGEFFLTVRKYPLLPSFILAVLQATLIGFFFLTGRLESMLDLQNYLLSGPAALYFMSRLFILVVALLTLFLVYRISRRLFPHIPGGMAVILAISGTLFLLFDTAIRPHMLIAGATTLTYFLSLRLVEDKSRTAVILAFGAATLSFLTLQNGLLAFVFPLGAFLFEKDALQWRRLFSPSLWILFAGIFLVSLLIGYPFLLRPLFGLPADSGWGLGNTDLNSVAWNGIGFMELFHTALGEPFLALFACIGVFRILRKKEDCSFAVRMLLLYFVLFILLFGLHGKSSMRVFLPLIPLAAILGARAFAASRQWILVVCVFALLIHMKFFFLAVRPDTYDQARAFLRNNADASIVLDIPLPFLGLTQEETARVLPFDRLPEADIVVARSGHAPYLDMQIWQLCARTVTYEAPSEMFLWSEVYSPIPWLLRAERLGPPFSLYCRDASRKSGDV